MADQKQYSNPPAVQIPAAPAAQTTEQLLLKTLAALAESQAQQAASNTKMAEIMEQQAAYNKAALKIAPRRKKSMAEYLSDRKKRGITKFLPHLVYQNGRPVNPAGLSKETITKLDQLATGHYCDGLLDVVRMSDGIDGINSRIHICYNNKTDQERMSFYMRFPTFTKIVEDVTAEMKTRKIAPVIEKGMDEPEFDFPEDLKELI